jgi:hypothetical protein
MFVDRMGKKAAVTEATAGAVRETPPPADRSEVTDGPAGACGSVGDGSGPADAPPRRSRRFERGSHWPALLVAALTLVIVGAWTGVDAITLAPTTVTQAGQTVTLTADGLAPGRALTFAPVPGWTIVPTVQADALTLRREQATVTVTVKGAVTDLDTYARREARLLAVQQVQTAEAGDYHSVSGFVGHRAQAIGGGRQGELLVLGKDAMAVTVLALGEPGWWAGHQAEIAAMVGSMRWG